MAAVMEGPVKRCLARAIRQVSVVRKVSLPTKSIHQSTCLPSDTSRPLPYHLASFRKPVGFEWHCRRFTTRITALAAQGTHAQRAKDLNQKGQDHHEAQIDDAIGQEKEKQARTPWHREGSDLPPVKRPRSAGAMTKGKLLTTPSRLLKLILPLTTVDKNTDRKDIEPLALLVHPQQPLSYLERLIQSELPTIKNNKGEDKMPAVHFRAEDLGQDSLVPKTKDEDEGNMEETNFDGKVEKTGKINRSRKELRGGPGEGGVESYSGAGREQSGSDDHEKHFVRWSSSTEIGDFIRDAARGKEFEVEIEGTPENILVGVPSFNDRTYYLRMRLRKTARQISDMASIKKECDQAAHKGAQRVAFGGFGVLITWWYTVYRLTFESDYGWDTMEPVTYLVGLSTLIASYCWFLWHNREVSYRSALNLTISRRQSKLYERRGFDLHKWDSLIEEGNALRKEIKAVAREYDVEWDEKVDEHNSTVKNALQEERRKQGNGKDKGKKGKDDEEDDD